MHAVLNKNHDTIIFTSVKETEAQKINSLAQGHIVSTKLSQELNLGILVLETVLRTTAKYSLKDKIVGYFNCKEYWGKDDIYSSLSKNKLSFIANREKCTNQDILLKRLLQSEKEHTSQ